MKSPTGNGGGAKLPSAPLVVASLARLAHWYCLEIAFAMVCSWRLVVPS